MKLFFTIFALFLLTSVSLHAQSAPDAPEITRMLHEFLAGAGRNDSEIHDRFWAEDLIYTRSAGARVGKEELLKGVRSAPAAKPGDSVNVYTSEDLRIQQYGYAVIVAFKLVSTTTKPDGTKTISNHLNTGTFIKRNGKWQVVAWQATTIPNPTTKTNTQSSDNESTPAETSQQLNSIAPRTYAKGPRGGCYYLNSSGKKTYVDHSYCK